jgi:DNA invertase Pin-like site-specific DNA recombinase
MSGKRVGYIRVSTWEQNPGRQLEGMELDKKFIDYASGKSTNRPELQKMLDYIREDDSVYVHSIDRLARNIKDLLDMVDHFIDNGIKVYFIQEGLQFTDKKCANERLILSIFGTIHEFFLKKRHDDQMEGIRKAQAEGKYRGKQKTIKGEKLTKLISLWNAGLTKGRICFEMSITRPTLDSYIKHYALTRKTPEEKWKEAQTLKEWEKTSESV